MSRPVLPLAPTIKTFKAFHLPLLYGGYYSTVRRRVSPICCAA